jgi:hypothetical protein
VKAVPALRHFHVDGRISPREEPRRFQELARRTHERLIGSSAIDHEKRTFIRPPPCLLRRDLSAALRTFSSQIYARAPSRHSNVTNSDAFLNGEITQWFTRPQAEVRIVQQKRRGRSLASYGISEVIPR